MAGPITGVFGIPEMVTGFVVRSIRRGGLTQMETKSLVCEASDVRDFVSISCPAAAAWACEASQPHLESQQDRSDLTTFQRDLLTSTFDHDSRHLGANANCHDEKKRAIQRKSRHFA